jgi:hypothetical protein
MTKQSGLPENITIVFGSANNIADVLRRIMDLDKKYYDREGNEKNILQMVKCEPEWAANRIQAGEKAISELKEKTEQIETLCFCPIHFGDCEYCKNGGCVK